MVNVHKLTWTIIALALLVCVSSAALAVPIDPNIRPSFVANDSSGITPLSITFTDTTTNGGIPLNITSMLWDFGDGKNTVWNYGDNNVTNKNPTHVYLTGGNYSVILTETNSTSSSPYIVTGNNTSAATQINVGSVIPNFTANVTSGSPPLTVKFTDSSIASNAAIMQLQWTFDENGEETEATDAGGSIVHTFTTNGNHSVRLSAVATVNGTSDDATNTTFKQNYIQVASVNNPIPRFNASVTNGTIPLFVHFADTSIGSPTKWLWDFGDGYGATVKDPSHTYNQTGTFGVSLEIQNATGVGKVVNYTFINVGVAPIGQQLEANFTAIPLFGQIPLLVRFNDTTKFNTTTGATTSWSWNFGDGNTSTLQNPAYTYYTVGFYNVSLKVTDALGNINTTTKLYYITAGNATVVPHGQQLEAGFTAIPLSGNVPLSVQFSDTSKYNATAGAPISWIWEFGNGNTSTLQNPQYIYEASGLYNVSLTVTDDNGNMNTTTKPNYINVMSGAVNPPVVTPTNNTSTDLVEICDFWACETSGAAPFGTTFFSKVAGSENIRSWKWIFEPPGDDYLSSHPIAAGHTFKTPGVFDITLQITDTNGNVASMTKLGYITVTGGSSGMCGAKAAPATTCFAVCATENSKVSFVSNTVVQPQSCTWNFGDGKGTHEATPTHTYNNAGDYKVTLTIKDDRGTCVKKNVGTVTVKKQENKCVTPVKKTVCPTPTKKTTCSTHVKKDHMSNDHKKDYNKKCK